jgi:hypothetical protein
LLGGGIDDEPGSLSVVLENGYVAVNLGSLGGDVGQAFGINNINKAVGYWLYPETSTDRLFYGIERMASKLCLFCRPTRTP